MEQMNPIVIENRNFVDLEEEDIQRLNRIEAGKFENNPEVSTAMAKIVEELGPEGQWEEHWLTVDSTGKRAYTRIYYTDTVALALTSDARIIREIDYPRLKEKPAPQTLV